MTSLRQKICKVVGQLRKEKDYAELLSGSAITFVLRLASFLILYVLNFVIANAYGAEELGNFTLSLTLLDVALMTVLFGLDTAMVRLIAQYESNDAIRPISRIVRRVLTFVIPVSLLGGGVLWLLSGVIAKVLFHDAGLTKDFQMMALALPFSVLTRLFSAGFRGRKQIRRSLLFDAVGIRAVNLVLLLLLLWGFGVRRAWILDSLVVAYVLNTILSWGVWQADLKRSSATVHSSVIGPRAIPKLRTIIRISLPMYLTASMYFVMGWTDTVVLGIFKSPDVVGVYSVVLKLSIITSFVYISVNTILLPKFSELHYNGHLQRLQSVIETSTQLMFWTSMPVILVLTVFSRPLLAIFGPAFAAGRVALLILCLGQVVNSATGSVISLLNMTGHQDKSRNALVVASLLNVVGNVALVPHFGMVGASVATAVSSIMRDVIASFYSYRIFGFRTWYVPRRERTGRVPEEKTEEAIPQMKEFPKLWFEGEAIRKKRREAQKPWDKEEFWAFYALRPFSMYVSLFLAKRTKVSPNALTLLAIFFSCLSSAGFMLGTKLTILLGCLLYQISYLFDCVDGEVARLTRRESKWGVWLDNGLHYTYYVVYFGAVIGVLNPYKTYQMVSIYIILLTICLELFVSSGFELAFPNASGQHDTVTLRKNKRWLDAVVFFLFSYNGFQLGLLAGTVCWYVSGSTYVLLCWTAYSMLMTLAKAAYKVKINLRSLSLNQESTER